MAWRGDLDAAASAFERATTAPADAPTEQIVAKDSLAYLAFQRGDIDAVETLATRALTDDRTGELRKRGLSPWLLVWVEAVRGHRAAAQAQMAKLDRNVPFTQLAQVWALAELGEWQEAARRADAAMKSAPPVPSFDYAEAHAFLGITRAEVGDFPGAIPELEEVLGVVYSCCDEHLYFVPSARFALARALLATGGDKQRAHDLAVAARDGFNPAQAAERARVEQWLAAHPEK
jgi:tetratricopeptide (TPR) repeat protein